MKRSTLILQDTYFDSLCREGTEVSIFLINGIQLSGKLEGFDQYTVLLGKSGHTQIIYKHAIATILPAAQKRVRSPFGKVTLQANDAPKPSRSMDAWSDPVVYPDQQDRQPDALQTPSKVSSTKVTYRSGRKYSPPE